VEKTQNKIFKAVVFCLDHFGYYETSINKVLQYAGVSRGALTHHFNTKEAMIVETLERILDPVRGKRTLWDKRISDVDQN
jgi:AcrR family transcriptional regulator